MKMRVVTILTVGALWCCLALLWMHRRAPLANPAVKVGLTFVDPSSKIPSVLPGTYNGVAILQNKSAKPVSNVRLTTSCFCTHVDGNKSLGTLQPGASKNIRFHLDCIKPGIMTESINASEGPSPFPVTEQPIAVRVLNPIVCDGNTLSFPILHRSVYGSPTAALKFTAPVAPGITNLNLRTDIPWLHVRQASVRNGMFHAMLYADGDAPEGTSQTIARMVIQYNGHSAKGEMPCVCVVRSAVSVKPHNLFFGVMHAGQMSGKFPVILSGNLGASKQVSVQCGVPGLQCHIAGYKGGTLTVVAQFSSHIPGNIAGNITVMVGKRAVARVPVSAFVVPK